MYNHKNASDTKNAYRFQDAVSLYIFVTNIKNNIEKVNPEGSSEDVELYFKDKTCAFFQAKENIHVNSPMGAKKLKSAVSVLLDDVKDEDRTNYKLNDAVIVTNSNVPLGKKFNKEFDGDYTKVKCKELTNEENEPIKRQIKNITSANDTFTDEDLKHFCDKLSLMKIYYFGDDDESRFKQIYKKTDELINDMDLKGQNRTLIKYWKDLFGDTSTKEKREVTVEKFAAYTEMVAMQSLGYDEKKSIMNDLHIDRENRGYINDKYDEELDEFSNDLSIRKKIEKEYKKYKEDNKEMGSCDLGLNFASKKFGMFMNDLGLDSSSKDDCQLAEFIIMTIIDNLSRFKKIEGVLINEN